jgi:hypothetical protein
MLYLGPSKIKEINYGSTTIAQVYKGTDLVFARRTSKGVILTLNEYIPAANKRLPDGATQAYVSNRTGYDTYSWKTPIIPGTYTLRFNCSDADDSDTVTCDITSDYALAVKWNKGTHLYTELYVSTTGLLLVYGYQLNSINNLTWDYEYYANKYITTVEII